MIVLDTHIWVWWVDGNPRLTQAQAELIQAHQGDVPGDQRDLLLGGGKAG